MADRTSAAVWPRVTTLPTWHIGCDVLAVSQHVQTSRDTRDVVLMLKPSPLQQRSAVVEYPIATQTPRTNHPVKRPAKCQWPVDHVVHVPCGVLQASGDGIRCVDDRATLERRSDSTHMWVS